MAAAVQPLAAESADELSEFLRDIMSLSLFDGGSSYWAEARNIDVSGVGPSDLVSFDIRPHRHEGLPFTKGDPRNGWKTITPEVVEQAIQKIIAPGAKLVNERHVSTISDAYRLRDAGVTDIEDADVIIQIAAFGEIVFG